MKKSLIALAVLAAAGTASAQSSVTLFGVVDATIQNLRADSAAGGSIKVTRLHNSAYNSSRIGFRGTEDLGGGMSASFWLEAGINTDDGTGVATSGTNRVITAFNATTGANAPVRSGTQGLTFNRRSTLSLSGGWGEVRIGRDYTPTFLNLTVFDPFGTNGSGAINNVALALGISAGVPTIVRASNAVQYFLPANLGGFYGNAMYAFHENVEPVTAAAGNNFQDRRDGEHVGLRFGYAQGPFNVAYAYGNTKARGAAVGLLAGLSALPTATVAALFGGGEYRQHNLSGSWDFGVAKLLAQINQERLDDGDGDFRHRSYTIGGLIPVGAGEIRLSFTRGKSDDNIMKGNQIAVGYVHNLSKRTALYTTYSRLNNSGSVAALNYSLAPGVVTPSSTGGDSRGFDFGIRHSF